VPETFQTVSEGAFLRTSPFTISANFAFWSFSEVRYPQATPK
jgi:hypothetical protein